MSPDDSRLDAWVSAPGPLLCLLMFVLAVVGVAGALVVVLVQGASATLRTAVSWSAQFDRNSAATSMGAPASEQAAGAMSEGADA